MFVVVVIEYVRIQDICVVRLLKVELNRVSELTLFVCRCCNQLQYICIVRLLKVELNMVSELTPFVCRCCN